MTFSTQLLASDRGTLARRCCLTTPHGEVQTPAFMPVGTYGAVRSLSPQEVAGTGASIILCNTYHLYLRPGHETVKRLGGLHRFMGWSGPVLTDSGGFQVFSLAGLRRVREEGVEFRSHLDGSTHHLTPELAIDVQAALGSDISMVLDECPPAEASREAIVEAMTRTTAWAQRSKRRFRNTGGAAEGRALFGIIQGGVHEDLRREHSAQIVEIGFDGYAVGGVSVGEPPEKIHEVGRLMGSLLPSTTPRYIMGLGTPSDIVRLIGAGFDLFDCVLPTRNARNGTLFTSRGKVNIKNAEHSEASGPVDEQCSCATCLGFGRAYLRHLFLAGEILAHRLNTIHNLTYYQTLIRDARAAIDEGRYDEWARGTLARMSETEA